MEFQTMRLPELRDKFAPDGSEIRLLPALAGGSMAHCTLMPSQTSQAVVHRSVEEIWLCLQGRGQVWRKQADTEETVEFVPGVAITIPLGTQFQFRNVSPEPMQFVIVTMPPWPGADEAIPVENHWPVAL